MIYSLDSHQNIPQSQATLQKVNLLLSKSKCHSQCNDTTTKQKQKQKKIKTISCSCTHSICCLLFLSIKANLASYTREKPSNKPKPPTLDWLWFHCA